MTAPPVKKPIATCQSKRRHADELTARAAAMRAIEIHRQVERLYVYHCPYCNGWHLTKHSNGTANLVTADNPIHQRKRARA